MLLKIYDIIIIKLIYYVFDKIGRNKDVKFIKEEKGREGLIKKINVHVHNKNMITKV